MADDFTPDNLEAAGALTPAPDPGYSWPEDPRTAAALEHWRDLKVGVIIHWGIYSAIHQGGSWSLHRSHLGDFTDPPADWEGTDAQYHTWYCDQARHFRGEEFDACEWARACANAGIKYVVFTTKHHDGFAMYDTAYSNFKCTSEAAGLGRDIFAEVTEAFRAEGLETGVYFSKADWHRSDYWDRSLPISDRFHNYSIADHPKKWQRFVEFTHDQIEELLSNYGKMNVLWLDAGWVRSPEEPIDIDGIARRARELQPDILVVDREVHGPEENYRTPEQALPDHTPEYPWESCITMTKTWCSLQRDEPIKPMTEIIHNLLAIVSRGGNYLIGIGPDATGQLSPHISRGLAELGQFLEANAEGIYGTRVWSGAQQVTGKDGWEWFSTQAGDDSQKIYLFGMPSEAGSLSDTSVTIPPAVKSVRPLAHGSAQLASNDGQTVIKLQDLDQCHYAVGLALELA